MTASLRFAEAAALQDMATYIARARKIQEQGIRLQAVGPVLAAWVPVMTPGSLVSRLPAVLGLRTAALEAPQEVDATVELGAVTERLARLGPSETQLPLPPSQLTVPWAAVTPPRSGWQPYAEIADDVLRDCAEAGIAEIAKAVPDTAGAAVVEQVREEVWGRTMGALPAPEAEQGSAAAESLPGLPAGAAFGAHALNFLAAAGADGRSTIHRQGPWWRLSSTGGFILARPAPSRL